MESLGGRENEKPWHSIRDLLSISRICEGPGQEEMTFANRQHEKSLPKGHPVVEHLGASNSRELLSPQATRTLRFIRTSHLAEAPAFCRGSQSHQRVARHSPPSFSRTPLGLNSTQSQKEGRPPRAQSRENDAGARIWKRGMENIQHAH